MTTPGEVNYDNAFEPDSVYGHALDLLRDYQTRTHEGAIHLDVGSGYGRLAEPLTKIIPAEYVGIDADPVALASLQQRGFETHQIFLSNEDDTLRSLRQIIGGRKVISITMLDTLEHLPNGIATLRALARLAAEHQALVVISVPNFAHADIAAKLILGRLDITDVGLLDHTHMRTFTASSLDAELKSAGLYKVDEKNTRKRESDQHFPKDHSLLSTDTAVGAFIRQLREQVDMRHIDVMQLVRICAPGPISSVVPWKTAYTLEKRPFLSVVIRTQGRRLHTLREALLGLYGQTDRDIEILVVGHKLSNEAIKAVERVIDDQPVEMRSRSRFLRVEDGERTRPLNFGFSAATGQYISILDDDDVPFAHWVETFRQLHSQAPGRLLRASCVRQSVRSVVVQGEIGLRAEESPKRVYPPRFDILEHLRGNHTPPVTVAFPRGAFHDLGIQFDEVLTTTEDWDYIMRVALMVGVSSSSAVTSVYRWWETGESSRSLHSQAEWDRNYATIINKMDAVPLLLPAGTAGRLRFLLDSYDRLESIVQSPAEQIVMASAEQMGITEETIRENQRMYQENQLLRHQVEGLTHSINTSFALRVSRSLPLFARIGLRGVIRGVWRLVGGRFWLRMMSRS
jgi:2-polyprenyl-3-methyl-5-hydroxy-6-metoxy-1,4-benzoquinol methylase